MIGEAKNFDRTPLLKKFFLAIILLAFVATPFPLAGLDGGFFHAYANASSPQYMPPKPGLLGPGPKGISGPSSKISIPFFIIPKEKSFPAYRTSTPVSGTARVLVVFVEFPDKAFGNNLSTGSPVDTNTWNSLLFTGDTSMNSYYQEVSYNKFSIAGGYATTIPILADHNMTYYGADNGSNPDSLNGPIYELVREVARKLYNMQPKPDLSSYDTNNDGIIDHLIIIHAGPGQEESDPYSPGYNPYLIWSHRWEIPGGEPIGIGNGKTIYAKGYTMQPDDGKLGVFAHEFAHDLGLPDLYDYDYDSYGLGRWSLMAAGSWNDNGNTPAHMSAWEKTQLGWLTPQNITKQQIDIPTVSSNPVAYRLPLESSYEYFLIENRQQEGFDAALPGFGLLIYHVDESMPNNDNQYHYKVALEQADNLRDLEYAFNSGDSGDPYPGLKNNRSFMETSSPNNRSYQGKPSTVALNYIGDSGTSMTINAILTITATGGIVEDTSGAKVEFPANAVLRDSVVRITVVDPANIPPSTDSRIKALSNQKVWDFEPSGTRFSKPVKITLPYDLTGSSGITEDNLRIFYYDPKEIAWLPVGGKIDKTSKTVTAEVNHFSMYTVMESSLPVSTSGNLISYLALTNNPFSPNGDGKKDNTIFKFNLARDARVNIRIYDSQGNLVVTLVEGINQMAGAGTIVWDGTNQAGQTVGSGIYVFKIEAADEQGQSQTMTKPVAVVRPR